VKIDFYILAIYSQPDTTIPVMRNLPL